MSQKNHVAPIFETNVKTGNHSFINRDTDPDREFRKSQIVKQEKNEKVKKFNAFYKQLGAKVKLEEKRIDYVLVNVNKDIQELDDEHDKEECVNRTKLREKFEAAMKDEDLQIKKVLIGNKMYTIIHCPFRRLCEEAEAVSLEIPLLGCESKHEDSICFHDWIMKHFDTDNEVDMISAPFAMDRIHMYEKYDDPTHFFRPALRSLLLEHILINIDLRHTTNTRPAHSSARENSEAKNIGNCWGLLRKEQKLTDLQKVGLDYMIMEDVYTGRFTLHEESMYDPEDGNKNKNLPHDPEYLNLDPRLDMQLTWTRFFKFQPLWKIRNYFGEKIAFYFAWSGMLITTLWFPMLFGFAIFVFGLVKSIQKSMATTPTGQSGANITDLFQSIKASFDNEITPYYALFISVWGTFFLEMWKRKQSELAYQWDVEQFEENEPDRPEFYGTEIRTDPVTKEKEWYYPLKWQARKIFLSSLTLLFMVFLVIASVMGVIVYRVFATVDYCLNLSNGACIMVSTILSSLLNAISVLILGKIYDLLAKKLTDWENHRTQTMYNDALIIKLFAFQFVNNYASCFYIAFFRGRFDDNGIMGQGLKYQDNCEGTCMSQLSFQVLTLMLTKPLPKFLSDVLLPLVKKYFKRWCQCCACISCFRSILNPQGKPNSEKSLLEIESEKPSLGNFTLGEYTEKIIQYGLMMLFAASFPLAPLLALLTNLIDLRIDATRMLWWNKRPMAVIAEDIGTWYVILQLLNFCGVASNAFLIAFTSDWGSTYDTVGKLWIVIGFEHIVFILKFLLAYLIPDVPSSVALALRKKHYQFTKAMDDDKINTYSISVNTTQNLGTIPDGKQNFGDPVYLTNEITNPGWQRKKKSKNNFDDETDVRRLKRKKKHYKSSLPNLYYTSEDGENADVNIDGNISTDYSRRDLVMPPLSVVLGES